VTPADARRFRRAWRRGALPPFRATPPQPPVPSPGPGAEDVRAGRDRAEMERLVELADLPDDLRAHQPGVAR